MIKYSKILLLNFFALSISSLDAMQEIEHFSKKTIKDMIIKYQIDETTYLTKLLSLSRENINDKFIKWLTKYREYEEELQTSVTSKSCYAEDFKRTKHKFQQANTQLKVFRKRFGEETAPYTNRLADSKILEQLLKNYELSIKEEQLSFCIDIKNKKYALKKITLILEALHLNAISEEDLNKNKKLYKQLSLKFHPDKIKNLDDNIKQEKAEFFKTFTPLLSEDKSTDHLNNIVKAIHEKRNEIIEQINNPSTLTYAGHFLCLTALPPIGQAIGTILCHKTFAQIMPRSEGENILRDICVTKTRETALEIETKLVKIPHHP